MDCCIRVPGFLRETVADVFVRTGGTECSCVPGQLGESYVIARHVAMPSSFMWALECPDSNDPTYSLAAWAGQSNTCFNFGNHTFCTTACWIKK